MSFAMVPTVEMQGPAGRVIVNNSEEDKASWIERGYTVVDGSAKGSVIGVVTEEDLVLENQAKIDQALEDAKIEKNPAAAKAVAAAAKAKANK